MLERIINFKTVWLAPTYNCNNRCSWCYAASNTEENRRKGLTRQNEREIINLLHSLGIKQLIVIGGEPTLYPDLTELIGETTRKGIRTGLVTNGRRLKEMPLLRSIKKSGIKYISFSIEGYNASSHDNLTSVRGSFNESMSGLENSIAEGIKTNTNTTIGKENKDSLERIVDLLGKYRLNSMTFNICGVCVSDFKNDYHSISPTEGIKAFERAYSYAKSKGLNIKLISPIPLCNLGDSISDEAKKDNAVKGSCHILSGRNFVVDYNGDILPCTHFTGFPMFNIFKDGKTMLQKEFISEYNNPEGKGQQLREKLGYYPSKKCENNCEEKCTGGCPVFWLKYNPETEIRGKKNEQGSF